MERDRKSEESMECLEPEDGEAVLSEEWEAAWALEIDRRVREIREGRVELIDADEAHAQVRAAIEARGQGKGEHVP